MPINHIIYADSMVLLAPSSYALPLFLNKFDFTSSHDIVYNTKVTVGMCVKPNQLKRNIVHEFVVLGNNLKRVGNHKYIGVQLTSN